MSKVRENSMKNLPLSYLKGQDSNFVEWFQNGRIYLRVSPLP